MIKIDKYIDFFQSYISNYDLSLEPLIRKKNHTMRVMENCNNIAKSLNLTKEDVFLSNIIGLFHDIGRFEQYKTYGKFRDYETIDHANLSVDILKKTGVLDEYEYEDIVYVAIRNHNKLNLEDDLNDKERLFCNIIRDADKLDILLLVIKENDQDSKEKIKLGNFNSKYSESAINDIINGKTLNVGKYPDLCDKSLVKLGLFNDVNFDYTKKKIYDANLVDKIQEAYIKSNPIEEGTIKNVCKVIKERLGK